MRIQIEFRKRFVEFDAMQLFNKDVTLSEEMMPSAIDDCLRDARQYKMGWLSYRPTLGTNSWTYLNLNRAEIIRIKK